MSEVVERTKATVAVVGLGYIGLPTAAVLAMHGVRVVGVDINPKTVAAVNRGEVPFVEPDLETAVAGAVSQGRLTASAGVPIADIYIVAVPTPFAGDYEADLSYIDDATDAIAPRLSGGELVILESTSPPGTTQHLADRLLKTRPDLSMDGSNGRPIIQFAHCPERVLPGRVMVELVTNDRVVGGLTPAAAVRAKSLYEIFCQGEIPLTDAKTAELAKLVENSYRDVNIAFANELATISDELGIDVRELIRLANRHPRVNILEPGPGVGGHCIAVDPWFIVSSAPKSARLIRTAREVNDGKPREIVNKMLKMIASMPNPTIAALGLAFKSDIDDLRESPALAIVQELAKELPAASIHAVEPNIGRLPDELIQFDNIRFTNAQTAVESADAVLLLVRHSSFRYPTSLREAARGKLVLDACGAWQ